MKSNYFPGEMLARNLYKHLQQFLHRNVQRKRSYQITLQH